MDDESEIKHYMKGYDTVEDMDGNNFSDDERELQEDTFIQSGVIQPTNNLAFQTSIPGITTINSINNSGTLQQPRKSMKKQTQISGFNVSQISGRLSP